MPQYKKGQEKARRRLIKGDIANQRPSFLVVEPKYIPPPTNNKNKPPFEACPGSGTEIKYGKRRRVRCPECNRRLLLQEVVNEYHPSELYALLIPPHKPKGKKK